MGRVVSYARLYAAAFARGRGDINTWLTARLHRAARAPLAQRSALAKHVHTLARTQHIGTWLNAETLAAVVRARTLARLATLALLRKLQRRIVRHLWRPDGALARREAERCCALLAGR
jgi:hypothetical protein